MPFESSVGLPIAIGKGAGQCGYFLVFPAFALLDPRPEFRYGQARLPMSVYEHPWCPVCGRATVKVQSQITVARNPLVPATEKQTKIRTYSCKCGATFEYPRKVATLA
jgi:hypothetical protein